MSLQFAEVNENQSFRNSKTSLLGRTSEAIASAQAVSLLRAVSQLIPDQPGHPSMIHAADSTDDMLQIEEIVF